MKFNQVSFIINLFNDNQLEYNLIIAIHVILDLTQSSNDMFNSFLLIIKYLLIF
jgi:hypothetical protein